MAARRGPPPWSQDFVGVAITSSGTSLDVMAFGRFLEADLTALERALSACVLQHDPHGQWRVQEHRVPDGLIWEIDGPDQFGTTFVQLLATTLRTTLEARGMSDVHVSIS